MGKRVGLGWVGVTWTIAGLWMAGCTSEPGDGGDQGATEAPRADTGGAGGQGGAGTGGAPGSGGDWGGWRPWLGGPGQGGPCPADMVHVGSFCVDRFEAPNEEGAAPLVMHSALTAEAWCGERGKRLCTEDEWDLACQGPEAWVYPYGDEYQPGACNDDKVWIPPDEQVLATWPSPEAQAEVEALYQGAPSGSYPGCVSSHGVFDMTGNVEEWVVRTKYHVNEYPHVLKGCYWSGCFGGAKPRCASTNPAHASAFKFYETGFRCCKDAD